MQQSEFNKRVNQDIKALMADQKYTEHLVLEGNSMVCKHCQTKQQLKMPTTFENLDALFEKFIGVHQHCEADEPTKSALAELTDTSYHAGFDHGCDYIVHEAEYWVREEKGTLAEFVQYMQDFKRGSKKV
jgi:hypothetical protein